MKRSMIALLVALTLGMGTTATAQKPNKQYGDRTEMRTKMATRMANELKLDDNTQAWFIPLYAEYQDTLRSVRREFTIKPAPELLKPKADNDKEKTDKKNSKKAPQVLTDTEAQQMIDNTFAREERILSLKRAYYDKFKAKLTPQQLVTLFCSKPNRNTAPGRQQFGGRQGGMRQGGQFGGPQGGMMPMGGGFDD